MSEERQTLKHLLDIIDVLIPDMERLLDKVGNNDEYLVKIRNKFSPNNLTLKEILHMSNEEFRNKFNSAKFMAKIIKRTTERELFDEWDVLCNIHVFVFIYRTLNKLRRECKIELVRFLLRTDVNEKFEEFASENLGGYEQTVSFQEFGQLINKYPHMFHLLSNCRFSSEIPEVTFKMRKYKQIEDTYVLKKGEFGKCEIDDEYAQPLLEKDNTRDEDNKILKPKKKVETRGKKKEKLALIKKKNPRKSYCGPEEDDKPPTCLLKPYDSSEEEEI